MDKAILTSFSRYLALMSTPEDAANHGEILCWAGDASSTDSYLSAPLKAYVAAFHTEEFAGEKRFDVTQTDAAVLGARSWTRTTAIHRARLRLLAVNMCSWDRLSDGLHEEKENPKPKGVGEFQVWIAGLKDEVTQSQAKCFFWVIVRDADTMAMSSVVQRGVQRVAVARRRQYRVAQV